MGMFAGRVHLVDIAPTLLATGYDAPIGKHTTLISLGMPIGG